MKRRLFPALLALVLAVTMLGGCAGSTPSTDDPVTTTTTTTTATTTTTTTNNDTTDGDPAMYNRLTGEYNNAGGANSRPVAVMVPNDTVARPQVGLADADIFFENETEGAIPRIMAVFADVSRVPAQLAPVRSARTPFVKNAQALDAIYVHAGGSTGGMALIDELGINNISSTFGRDSAAFWRDQALRDARDYEHSLSTSGEKLAAQIKKLGYRTTSDRAPFTFGENASGTACTELEVNYAGSWVASFKYDAEKNVYNKYSDRLAKNNPHVMLDGTQLAVSNVVVMYDTKYAESDRHISFELKNGKGLLISGGKVRDIEWSRTADGLSFKEAGTDTDATFLVGKTYVCLLDKNNASKTVIR